MARKETFPYALFRAPRLNTLRPAGWLRQLLERQAAGLGRRPAASGYPFNTRLWAGPIPPPPKRGRDPFFAPWWPYEQTAYLVDGLTRAAILLRDDRLMAKVRPSLDAPLPAAATDGTLWPLAVYSRARVARDGDARSLLRAYRALVAPLGANLENRGIAILEGLCATGDRALAKLALRAWRRFAGLPGPFNARHMRAGLPVTLHGVTAAEIGKIPAIVSLATGDHDCLRQSLGFFNGVLRDHLLADGGVSAAEDLGPRAPAAEHETCAVNDFMWAWGYLLQATGDGRWADRIERCFFNAALGAVSKDFSSFQYFGAPDQAFATCRSSASRAPRWAARQSYRPRHDVACCAGNVHRLVPTYASRMWLLAADGGPVAALYGPSEFRFAPGRSVEEITDYPFSGRVTFRFRLKAPARFAFRYRVPGWTSPSPSTSAIGFRTVRRVWRDGDEYTVEFPMAPRLERQPDAGKGSAPAVALVRGPLVFTPLITEKEKPARDGSAFPDLVPGSPWNWAVVAEEPVTAVARPVGAAFPWTPEDAPVKLLVPCVRVPGWRSRRHTPPIPRCEAAGPRKSVTFVPSGATRLRMDVLPLL